MNKIPVGLIKCKVCNVYNGSVKTKDVDWKGCILEEKYSESEESLKILCLCESTLLCSKCKKNKIHRSMSMDYNEEDNRIWFRPCFASLVPCKECRTKGGMVVDTCPGQG